MELTESKVKCLLNGGNLNKLSEDVVERIMQIALSHVCGKSDTEVLTQIYGSKLDDVKTAYEDFSKLFVEAARHNSNAEEIRNSLQCTNLTKTYIDKLCDFYTNHKEELQESLESIGNSLPHIIDMDWQLDYCIKSSINNPAGFLVYNVSFSTLKHGNIEYLKFTCTIQELQELVYKLKDAARHTEKLTNS